MSKSVFFVGIGGSGMNGIARIMNLQNNDVHGSDRDRDAGNRPEFYLKLEKDGITLHPQNGSGITKDLDFIVTSTAIESQIPDIQKARQLGIKVIHRSEALSRLVEPAQAIAIAGTSGKSTVTGMCGWSLKHAGYDPVMLNGARVAGINADGSPSDILTGHGKPAVFEADESDGSLVRFHPEYGVLTNVTLDHKPMDQLIEIFSEFVTNIKETLIYNADCPVASQVARNAKNALAFSIDNPSDFQARNLTFNGFSSSFTVENQTVVLQVPGKHNIMNALATYGLLRYLGTAPDSIKTALGQFQGIYRRYQLIGSSNGITVIDDFAHNPDKIRATMAVTQQIAPHSISIFQPHGFGPTRFLFDDLVQTFSETTSDQHRLIVLPIFYAGGTVSRDVSSAELVTQINRNGGNAEVIKRNKLPGYLRGIARQGDYVVVMGARDPSLPDYCQRLLEQIK